MAGIGAAGVSLAEAYTMRAMYKEKMKKRQAADQITSDVVADDESNETPSGCVFWASKKSHSAKVSSAECDRNLATS
ncbi:hypothetical protein OWV82_024534 [Melia azedarach]|uniref:Uncharacterized protein n=1 Tax=Melia azedarach TaxID=155640 RepID=A0ACC1WQG2_MELAZ|nr:hypothetical protein OWV82_024534 [Melia azedarach]